MEEEVDLPEVDLGRERRAEGMGIVPALDPRFLEERPRVETSLELSEAVGGARIERYMGPHAFRRKSGRTRGDPTNDFPRRIRFTAGSRVVTIGSESGTCRGDIRGFLPTGRGHPLTARSAYDNAKYV